MRTHVQIVATAGAVFTAALLLAPTANAVFLVDDGFESPDFAVGALEGQQGWLKAGVSGFASVINDPQAIAGDRSLLVNRVPNADVFWGVPLTGAPTGRYATIQWDMNFQETGSLVGLGPFLGVTVFDETTSGIAVVASLGVDATTGDVLSQAEDTGFLFETGADATPGEWIRYRLVLDYLNDTFTAFVNDIQVVSDEGFVDRGLGIDSFSDASITAIGAQADFDSQGLSASARFDTFRVVDTLASVPGDFSGDGRVDNTDLNLLLVNWGTPVGPPPPGWNGVLPTSLAVDNDELNSLLLNWGFGTGSSAIPEPASLVLFILGGLAVRQMGSIDAKR